MGNEYDKLVASFTDEQTREWFDDLDQNADTHPPKTRQFYLALYRRLHG